MSASGKLSCGNWLRRIRLLAGVAAVGIACVARGQGLNITLLVEPSATSINLGDQVTYKISLTNLSGLTLQNLFVTNAFAPAQFVSASGTTAATQVPTITNSDHVTFVIQRFITGQSAQLTVTVQPTAAGSFTNTTTLFSLTQLSFASTNVVTEVSAPVADLSVTLAGPAGAIVVNDWVTYSVIATNRGPSDAPNVSVTNFFPGGTHLISLSPSNAPLTVSNNIALLSIGTLSNRQARSFSFRVQPTLPGSQIFAAGIGSAGIADTNASNNSATNRVNISPFLSTNLLATNASAMVYNPQTGLMDQTIQLVNIGTSSVTAARVIVSGLTNALFNAVGTNNGNPFVAYNGALTPGQGVSLLMEYFVPTRLPILVPNSAYQAVGVPTNSPPLPAGTPFAITRMQALASGAILVEFPSIPGRSYTILYSDNVGFTNALAAQPAIIAPADRVQWIDDGPPKTISPPTNTGQRFYRVLLDP